jgi:hypothetical protein
VELSTEGEFVFDTRDSAGSFFYSWMELSYSPLQWWRAGIVAQKTKAYHTGLDIQRGILVGFSHKAVDFTTYVFSAGWSGAFDSPGACSGLAPMMRPRGGQP